MAAESYIKWDGKEDNREPESRDDIYIVLARGHSRTMATLQSGKGTDGGNVICMSEVTGGWTEAFETLFANQEDPEFIDCVCAEMEHNLVDEVKDFVEEIMAIFEHFECIECLPTISPLEVEIQYLWTSENQIRIEIQNDFLSQLCRLQIMDEGDVIEELRELKKWMEVATELYLIHGGLACSHRWETFINMNFSNPKQFREMVESQMSDEE